VGPGPYFPFSTGRPFFTPQNSKPDAGAQEHFAYTRELLQMNRIEQRREKRDLLQTLPEVKPDAELQLDPGVSFTRPASPSEEFPDNKSPWRPLTNRDYAVEFKRRCTVLTKMRAAALSGQIPPSASRPSSPRLQAFTPQAGKTKLQEPDELTQNLWTCFLMLLENGEDDEIFLFRSIAR
jgi:hypothetical protein